MVEGYFDYDESAVEKLEYYETDPAYAGWHELTGNTFGPTTGFPFQAVATTSTFRVTFSEGGTFDATVGLRNFATKDTIVEDTITFQVADAPTVTVNAPDEFIVGQQTEYSVTTTGTTTNGNVLAYFQNSNDSIIEKVEYLETAVNPPEWRELTGNSFGPAGTGFPFTDGATSRFRVTFKEPGENTVQISLRTVSGNTVVAETTETLNAVSAIDRIDVVDGADGFTSVNEPKAGQVLLANIVMKDGTPIGTYPPNSNVTYEWYYEDAGNVLGTDSAYTVTSDNLGKVICLKVTVTDNGYTHTETWTAAAAVAEAPVEPEEPDDNDNDRPPYVPGGSGSGNRDDDEDTDDTSDVTPDNPGDVTPGTPGDTTPGTPGDATPGTPGDATPGTPDASGEDDVAQPPQTGVKVAGSLAILAGAAAVAAITFKKRGK